MEYQATAKYIHMSTRKVRLMADAIRNMNAEKALIALNSAPQHASVPLTIVIKSALANAKQKNAQTDKLMLKQIEIMGGPVMKRWHAVSKGMAHGYKKRMTHVRIVLAEIEQKEKSKK